MKRLLILGGTSEARRLAVRLADRTDFSVIYSLAGRTDKPAMPGVPCRFGGFGGVKGLSGYIKDQEIDLVVDATHPFASQMSRHAGLAADETGKPLLHLQRPPWVRAANENWTSVPDVAAAARALPPGARAFCATGRGSLDALVARQDIYTFLRVIDPPNRPFPGVGEFIVARPPFSVDDEMALFQRLNVSHLVVKNAGGTASRTKVTAAGMLGLAIFMVDRVPLATGAKIVEDIGQALHWIEKQG